MSNKAHVHNIFWYSLGFELPSKCWINKKIYIKAIKGMFYYILLLRDLIVLDQIREKLCLNNLVEESGVKICMSVFPYLFYALRKNIEMGPSIENRSL